MTTLWGDLESITLAGDWHGQGEWARTTARAAAEAGTAGILQLGDFGIWPGQVERYLDELDRSMVQFDQRVGFVDGNHEGFEDLEAFPIDPKTGLRHLRERVVHIPRGTRWQWAGMTWLGLGGATSVDKPSRRPGISWWAQEEITLTDASRAVADGPVDVMVTHDCPAGVTIPDLHGRWDQNELVRAQRHRELLRQVVDTVRPTHLWHGHFHTRYQRELDLGGGLSTLVTGLDRDGSGERSWQHVDLHILASESAGRRA